MAWLGPLSSHCAHSSSAGAVSMVLNTRHLDLGALWCRALLQHHYHTHTYTGSGRATREAGGGGRDGQAHTLASRRNPSSVRITPSGRRPWPDGEARVMREVLSALLRSTCSPILQLGARALSMASMTCVKLQGQGGRLSETKNARTHTSCDLVRDLVPKQHLRAGPVSPAPRCCAPE